MSRPSPYADEAPGGGLLAKLYTRSFLQLLGGLAIAVIVALLASSVAVFTHAFSNDAHVRLDLDRAGSQLSKGADVKVDGIIVGRVDAIDAMAGGAGATLDLAIDPDQLHLIPANVTAHVIPKSVFGEKYVELEFPREPATARLADGDVIRRDRSSVAVETRTVLNHLGPLLDAVSPAQLNTTLTAIATAVQGRGELMGTTIVDAGRFLRALRPSIPTLVEDAGLVAAVSDSYRQASEPLFRTLEQIGITARTVTAHHEQLEQLLTSTQRFADVARGFVDRVGERYVDVVAVSRPVLSLLARYSPELACVVRGVTAATPRLEAVFADGPYLKARMYVSVSRGDYQLGVDSPKDLDLSAYGPYCPVIPKDGNGTVAWPTFPKELDQLQGDAITNEVTERPPTGTNPLVGLLMGGALG